MEHSKNSVASPDDLHFEGLEGYGVVCNNQAIIAAVNTAPEGMVHRPRVTSGKFIHLYGVSRYWNTLGGGEVFELFADVRGHSDELPDRDRNCGRKNPVEEALGSGLVFQGE